MSLATTWFLIFLAFLIAEAITIGALFCLWFALGALLMSVITFAIPTLGLYAQCTIFFLTSVFMLAFFRKFVLKKIAKEKTALNSDRLIGLKVTLTAPCTPEKWGQVVINGVEWSAFCKDGPLEKNSLVEIVDIEGAKLIVKAAK